METRNTVTIDISTKKWLNLQEAIAYLGFGSKGLFQEWRESGKLPHYKPGKMIIYKKSDLDKMMEGHRHEVAQA